MRPNNTKTIRQVLHLQLKCPLMLGKPCMAHGCMLWVWDDYDDMPQLHAITWAPGTNTTPPAPNGEGWRTDGESYFCERNNRPGTEQKWIRDMDLEARGRCSRSQES